MKKRPTIKKPLRPAPSCRKKTCALLALGLAVQAWTVPVSAEGYTATSESGDWRQSIPNTGLTKGRVWFDTRYRFERVEQPTFVNPARASTLRLRPGLESGYVHGFRVGVEGDFIVEVGGDDFNNTINGRTNFPVVVDVESAEVNQAYIESHHLPGVVLTGGRYRKNIDNMRYIGSVGWRQNDQTFDGATANITVLPNTEIFYGYIGNVNRIFSDRARDGAPNDGNLESNTHLLNAKVKKLPALNAVLTGYAYLIDIKDRVGLSNASYGVHLKGKQKITDGVTFNYYAEYAHQQDYGSQPVSYDADYVRLAPGLTFFGLTTTFVYEKLGSDNGLIAFQTPLATGHVFNGFADVFLATPATGMKDYFIDITYKAANLPDGLKFLNGLVLKAQYHEFRSDIGNIDFGREFDFYAKMPIHKSAYAEFKYADYRAENFAVDTEKFIFGLGYKY